ncbi:hypothetical protein EON80_17900 [bacterium]|nr:MAG: hypothetical protein EON80_17900 [bacterium]
MPRGGHLIRCAYHRE